MLSSAAGIGSATIRWSIPSKSISTATGSFAPDQIRATLDADCPQRGAFSFVYAGNADDCGPLQTDPVPQRGLVAVRVNYPFQGAGLTARNARHGRDPECP